MRRRLFLKSAPPIGIAALAGCPGQSDDSDESTTTDTPTSPTASPETTTQEPDEATFELRNLSAPTSVERGDEVSISVDIRNTGERAGETTVEISIGSVTCSTTVELAPGESQTVSCSQQLTIPEGSYEVTVTESASFAVLKGELTVNPLVFDLPWSRLPGPPGGPVKDVAVSPIDDDYLYAITATAGMYTSSDGGRSWIQGPEGAHHGTRVVVNPHNPEVARSRGRRTDDGGNTWYTTSYKPERLLSPDPETQNVNDFEYDPGEEGVIYAAMSEGLRRTTDGGQTWDQVGTDVGAEQYVFNWVEAPTDSEGVVYALSLWEVVVLRSDDYGTTWEVVVGPDEIPNGTGRGLAVESDGATAYICVSGRGVYRVEDDSLQLLGPNIPSDRRGPYFLFYDGATLSADDERLYFHAFSLPEGGDSSDMWEAMRTYEYDTMTAEMHTVEVPEERASITAHPTDPDMLYFGGWSWVWKSTDKGNTWTALSNTFVDRYLSTVAANPDRPGTLVPGSICSGGIWTSHDHGQTYEWKRSGLGPFMEHAEDRNYEEHYAMRASAGGDRFYVTTAAGLLISEDNGDTWRLETGVPGYDTHGLDHYHGLGVDPNDPMRVYMGTGLGRHGQTNENRKPEPPTDRPTRIWRSLNGGGTWEEVTHGFPSDRRTVVQDILVSRADGDVVYVGTNANDYIAVGRGKDGGTGFGIFRSTTAGAEWEQLSTPFSNVHSLTQDAQDPETILASTPQGVYRSVDGGGIWEKVLSYPTKALLSHPEERGVVFAGAQKYENYWDLLVSTDGGETWGEGNLTIQVGTEPDSREYDGIDRNAHYKGDKGQIMDFAFDTSDSHLVAATRGASLWQGTVEALIENRSQ